MSHAHRTVFVGAVVFATLLSSHRAPAADLGITGKKLLLKSNPKMVLLSKDAMVAAGANGSSADPRCIGDGGGGLGGSVKLDDGSNSVTLNMPCAYWSTNGGGNLYKYKYAAGVPKVGKVKAGLLKVVSPAGMGGFPVPSGAATIDAEVQIGTDKYCMTFSGTGNGSKFLVKDSSVGACATPTPTSTDTPTPTQTPTPTETVPGVCSPGSMVGCYTGPGGTANVGICMAGIATCNGSGTGYGPCVGEVTPGTELCSTLVDEDCDGMVDEGCTVGYAADVQPILAAKCSPCHTTLGLGGANLATSYTDTQLASYYCASQTKGACALVRVQNGSMPLGAGCTGNPVLDIGNPSCLTAVQQNTLSQWIAQGQLP